jgi:Uma2 family endonuclease
MGAKTLISEADYLRMTFEGPEAEYVEGEVRERSMPNNEHSVTAFAFYMIFGRLMTLAPLFPRPELRFPVAPGRFRVADLAVYAHQPPSAEIPPEVPHVVVEVISPDDKYDELMVKLADYQNFGIPHIWLADPALRRLSLYDDGSLTSVPELALPEFGLAIKLAEVFTA